MKLLSTILFCLMMTTTTTMSSSPPVIVGVYYESLCSDCKEFISGQLFQAWKKLQSTGIMEMLMVPYGNARQTPNGDGSWKFECQHGPQECLGNQIEACLMSRLSLNMSLYFDSLHCMESSADVVKAAEECIANFNPDISFSDVMTCAEGREGNFLHHLMGQATEMLNPPHSFVPWITVNQEHTEHIQQQAETNLAQLVCDTFEGPKPDICVPHAGKVLIVSPLVKLVRAFRRPQPKTLSIN